MKIAVDYSWMGSSGIGRMATEVISRKPDRIEIIKLRDQCKNATPFSPLFLSMELSKAKADVFWSPGFVPTLFNHGIPKAITIHDLTHLHFYGAKQKYYYNFIIKPILKRLDLVFTVSDYSKNEIVDWAGIPEEKVVRVYNGVSTSFHPHGIRTDIGRPYILYVGNRRAYKNVATLIRAFAQSGLVDMGFLLALTGDESNEIFNVANELGIREAIYYLGYIPDTSLAAIYRGACALAFVSLYEGFGLPIIEAMACGTPVITSSTSSMPEVAGGAALLVDPAHIDDLAEGLYMLVNNAELRLKLIDAGLQRATDFSWDEASKQYWNNLQKLV